MSILVTELRSLIFSNLRPDLNPKIRKACWNLYNAIDADLDVMGYHEDTASSTTQEAIEKFQDDISGKNDLPDLEDEPDEIPEVIEAPSHKKLDISDDDIEGNS